jgi:hypothetical protein
MLHPLLLNLSAGGSGGGNGGGGGGGGYATEFIQSFLYQIIL